MDLNLKNNLDPDGADGDDDYEMVKEITNDILGGIMEDVKMLIDNIDEELDIAFAKLMEEKDKRTNSWVRSIEDHQTGAKSLKGKIYAALDWYEDLIKEYMDADDPEDTSMFEREATINDEIDIDSLIEETKNDE
jgi:hypothetical protein